VVDPDYRGQGILGRLGSALAELSRRSGFVGYVHYPTTAHSVMQTRSVANGGVETGVMLGYVPAATDYREIERPPGRIAATIVYQPFDPAPALSIYVPDRYQVLLGRLYGQMGLRRARLHSSQPVAEATEAASADSPGRGLLHIHVDRAGADIAAVVGRSMQASSAGITHVDLVLDDPGVDSAVNHLARLGFIYAGLLPGFARSDVLRLQHLRDQPASVFAPELANPDARSLLTLINSEHAGQPPAAGDPVHPGA